MFPQTPPDQRVTLPPGTPEPIVPRRTESTHALVCELLDRIAGLERKLDTLIAALDEEQEEEEDRPTRTLDGEPAGRERDQSQSLG